MQGPGAGCSSRDRAIEQTLLHIKGLVFARAILEDQAPAPSSSPSARPNSSASAVIWPNSSEISGLS